MDESFDNAIRLVGSSGWIHYFRTNSTNLLDIPWQLGVFLTDESRAAVATSVQEFQLGESSEGKHLIACAKRHAARTGDAAYVEALGLFIAEENRHARDLGHV